MSSLCLPVRQRYKLRTLGPMEGLLKGPCAAGFINLVCALVALACLVAPVLGAQTPGTGAIAGVVLDPSAAAVGNATVTIVDHAIGIERTVTTATDGSFRCSLL